MTIDEDLLKEEGVRDFDQYAIKKGEPLMPDFFLVRSDTSFILFSFGVLLTLSIQDEFDQGYIGGDGRKVDLSSAGKSAKSEKAASGGAAGIAGVKMNTNSLIFLLFLKKIYIYFF